MSRTIFDSRSISNIMHSVSIFLLKILGWELVGPLPAIKKYVLIAAPHTSNWDFLVLLLAAFGLRAKAYWMGKDTLFRRPHGAIFRWLGGIPVDRSSTHNAVDQSVIFIREQDEVLFAIAPEGTRKKVNTWKTGFYYIAHQAGVPIACGFIDYGRKRTGIGPLLMPTGDIEADMKIIREFYSDIRGKHHDQTGSIEVVAK